MNAPGPRRVGRFQLRRELGRGAQATVWRAHDPRLDREVALKLLDPQAGASLVEWLDEARAVSRLAHPNIVPLFEADVADGRPYLVFELVEGRTLAEAMRQRTRWNAREAVALLQDVLAALAAAHAQGIVHRDLKPSNVLLGSDGRARVMDFGIAARISGAADGRIVGTPGYISPEAARGQAPVPAMDVFAAGVLLAELLAGNRLLQETDPQRALSRVQAEDLALPADVAVDDALRGTVQRALARDAAQRLPDAQAMQAALQAWLAPADAPVAVAESGGHGTLDFLLRRMRLKGDFPALSESMARIHQLTSSDSESLHGLAAEILKDVALTNKLLRMVNSVHFSTAAGPVSTVSRAAALVGFGGIRNLALSLLLMEHMNDKAHAALLRGEFMRALLAGAVAGELAAGTRDAEELFLASLFQNLGRLLTEYYFPEEARAIRRDLPADASPERRDAAAARVLGIGFDELGAGVAKGWGLPENLLRAMRAPGGAVPPKPVEAGPERQRWIARAANELADALLLPEADDPQARAAQLAEGYAGALAMTRAHIVEALPAAQRRLAALAPAMGLGASPQPARREPAEPAAEDASAVLSAGISEITQVMAGDAFRLNDVLRMVLETMYRALRPRRVVFCLRDAKLDALTGRFGLGEGSEAAVRAFHVPLKPGRAPDLFSAVCAKGLDTQIADAAGIAARLPAWFRQALDAPAFVLLPLAMRNAPFALIYADFDRGGSQGLPERQLALLRTLRNQAVMAFRQAER